MSKLSRRSFLKWGAAGAGAMGLSFLPILSQRLKAQDRPIRAAMSNAGLQASWCAQGSDAAYCVGSLPIEVHPDPFAERGDTYCIQCADGTPSFEHCGSESVSVGDTAKCN